MFQSRLAVLPENATVISDRLACVRDDGHLEFFNPGGPIYRCAEDDKAGLRLAQGLLGDLGLATVAALSRVFGVSRLTIRRNRDAYRSRNVAAFAKERGPRGGYKLTELALQRAQEALDEGRSQVAAAKAAGVTEGTIRHALRQGTLRADRRQGPGTQPSVRSATDGRCEGGVAVKRVEERVLASVGELAEASTRFEAAESVPGAGVLLALPALLHEGLVEVTEEVYGQLEKGFFGLRSILLTLAFMALLRIRNAEQLKGHAPGELGLLLGLDRAPEMKTLRRKLKEVGRRGLARRLAEAFTRRWAEAEPEALGFLYVDGHVRPYHGRKHRLPETFVPRRRLCMPATTDTWVNDARAQPWFFVSMEANDGLLQALDRDVLPRIRKEGRVTVVFDREGWSPETFRRWAAEGVDVMTYRKGHYSPWPEEGFTTVEDPASGVRYRLAERETGLGEKRFKMREVRRLCDNGHQTVTTRRDLPTVEVASRMFARWNQENYFRYMRHEFALDHLCTYETEPADPERIIPNPPYKECKARIESLEAKIGRIRKQQWKDEKKGRTARSGKASPEERIKELEVLIEECEARLETLPERVPVKETMDEEEIVRLEPERKIFTDLVRMAAYRAESAMLAPLGPLLNRSEDEGRAFLQTLFRTPADLVPGDGCLTVRFHSMSQPRFNKALRELCAMTTREGHAYPGTGLKLAFEGPLLEN